MTALVWLRRDLRLADNPALQAALREHEAVLPVYVHAPEEEAPWVPGGASRWWLHRSLEALREGLRRVGATLVLRRGASLEQLLALARECGAEAVYWNRLYEPALTARDQGIKQELRAAGLRAESFNAALLVEPWRMKTGAGEPYRVFTPFWRAAAAQMSQEPPAAAPEAVRAPGRVPAGLALEELELLPRVRWDAGMEAAWAPGEAGAWARLEGFCEDAAERYREERDYPALPSTSRLSPHLHFGEISPRQVVARLRRLAAEQTGAGVVANVDHYVRELGWREFAHHLLYHYPQTPREPLHARFAAFPWRARRDYTADLRAWQRGRTGVPLVDAGMRELWHTGWMHNRVRMVAASFLTKNLLIPWQEGAAWFWDTLVDADLANNTLGWQWTAGCGADAAPYFRVFNPELQGAKFDADGVYLRRWVPELGGSSYPAAVVDLGESRERALAAYARIKGG